MLNLSLLEFIFLQAVILLASFGTTVVTFGFAMTVTPFLLLFLSPHLVVEMNVVLSAILFLLVSSVSWRGVKKQTLIGLLVGGALGIPFGVLLNLSLSEDALRIVLTGVVIVTAVLALLRRYRYFSREAVVAIPVGAIFAFLNAGLALGGPFVALFALNQRWTKDQTRAMLASFFVVVDIGVLASHVISGLLTLKEFKVAMLFVPVLVIGVLLATRLVGRVNERVFRHLIISAMFLVSIGVLVKAMIWGS